MKKLYLYKQLRLFCPAVCLSLLGQLVSAQAPVLPAKANLPQTLLSNRVINGTATDTAVKTFGGPGAYTVEVKASVNSATGRGLDIEGRNGVLDGFRLSLDATTLKTTNPLSSPVLLSNAPSGNQHTVRVAVRNDSAHIYQNGAYLLSQPLASVKDIAAGVETDNLLNVTTGPALIPGWAGTAGNNSGKPSDYGWLLNPASATLFAAANTSVAGTSRYMDVNASSGGNLHTYNGATYTGRLLYIRWDGGATNTAYAYPVSLEAGATYDFSLLYAYISNGTPGSSITVGIGTTTATSGRIDSKALATSTTIRALRKGDFFFTAPTSGTYYITIYGPTALYSIGDLSVNKVTAIPRFIFGKNYPGSAADIQIESVTYDSTGAFAPGAPTPAPRQTVTLTGSTVRIPTSFNTDFVVPGKTDVHFTAENTPYANSSIALNSNDAWLFFTNVRPAAVISNWLSTITINGAPAVNNSNVRIAVYRNGTAVIPNGNQTNATALKVFTQPSLGGASQTYPIQTIHSNLGAYNNAIRSFTLKRGYVATFANNPDGTGYSRVFVANDSDLVVNTMPAGLDTTVSFIRVMQWNWPSKKGKAGWSPDKVGATWYYDWNIGGSAAPNYEYQGIRQNAGWPDFNAIINKGVNHLLGFNEPDRPDQANMTVDAAIAQWPQLMKTGLRLGSPAPANTPNSSWLNDFMAKADALNYRVDFVAVHCYWGGYTPAQWYSNLKAIYDRYKRPLWITEWNNGANWTTETWPTDFAEQQQKQLNDLKGILQVMDTASFVERYAEYDWVQAKRALVLGDTLTPAGKYYFANKSDFAYNPARAFVHNWKLISATPTSVINSNDYNKVTINWRDLNGETSAKYLLERKIDGRDASYLPVQYFENDSLGSVINFNDSVYDKASYRVKAYANDTTVTVTSGVLEVVRDAAPVAPASLTGTIISSSRAQLTWTSATAARSYNLKRSLSAAGPWDTVAARTTALTYTDTTLTPATTYYYVVTALNSAGESANSAVRSITTPALVAPTNVISPWVASGDGKVILSWDFQYDAKYKVLRSLSETGPWDTVATDLSQLRYDDAGRTNGTTYYYKLVAYNQVGNSPPTAVLTAKPTLGQHLHIGFNETSGVISRDDWGAFNGTSYNNVARVAGKDSATGAVKMVKDADAYIQLKDGAVSTLNDFTIATWFKMPATQVSNTRVFDFGSNTGTWMALVPRVNSNNVQSIRYKITCAAGTYDKFIPYTLPLDTWVHLVISQQDSVFKVYVNGALQFTDSTASITPSDMGVTTRNYIARSQWGSDPYTEHAYDDFSIYNRALSDADIMSLSQGTVVVLPITLSSFTGRSTAQGNVLTWKVNTTSASIRMELEKGIDGRNFSPVYSTTASRAATQLPFAYTDGQAKGNINYYRLKMIDIDGKITYSPVVAISSVVKGVELVGLYPTMVNDAAYLSIRAEKAGTVRTVITDMNGRTVQSGTRAIIAGSNLLQVDTSVLASGTYTISIYTNNQRMGSIRFAVGH